GKVPLATRLVPPEMGPANRWDPVTATALRRFVQAHSMIADAPVTIALRELAAVTIDGEPAAARGLLRAMICQLAVLHAPDRLLIAAAISGDSQSHWDWLKWLPHNQHPSASDRAGSARMVYPSLVEARDALAGLLNRPPHPTPDGVYLPHAVVIVDGDVIDGGERTTGSRIEGLTVLEVGTGGERFAGTGSLQLRVPAPDLLIMHAGGDDVSVRPDRMDPNAALVCAQRLAAYRVGGPGMGDAWSSDWGARWQDLLGIADLATFDPTALWRSQHHRDRLRVPIGTTVGGVAVELDIKEAAENGIGPHGLCVGATGSGKSEFLRAVALGMMARHSPGLLNLVLVDFKGGATFLGLERAPHVAALITNLSDEAPLVERMRDALAGEINRRQEILRAAGNFVSVAAYEQARRAGAQLGALPALFIIVDEFSELLAQQPDFVDMFVAIGRLGRSLAMHLLLASQRLDEGRIRGLESHLSYRVCLKTLTANESRIVLGTADAYQLPNTPGAGFLRSGTGELMHFQITFVSAPCGPAVSPPVVGCGESMPSVRLFSAAPTGPVRLRGTAGADRSTGRTVLQAVVERLDGHGPPAHEIWLPPLGAPPTLDAMFHDASSGTGNLSVPIGIVDRPFEQRRTPLIIELGGAAGNVAVVGAPQSGKSTALRTLITALAVTHDPGRAQFYCLDFGGGALASIRSLPHTGSVAGRAEPDLVVRTIAQLESIIRRRELFFRENGIDSMAQYRRLRVGDDAGVRAATRETGGDRFADVFLVVDGWATMRQEFETLEAPITALAIRGLSFGVHVVLSASRWAEIRPALKDAIGTRIELRLGQAADSELDRKQAQRVPKDSPGRGLSAEGLHMLIALPRVDGVESSAGLIEAAARLGQVLRQRYGESAAPPVPLLPTHVDRHAVVDQAGAELGDSILLGLEEHELRPVAVDLGQHSHLLILGENECGKTTALRTLCREISRTKTAAQARLVIVDFRRGLLGVAESDHVGGYAMSPPALTALVPSLVDLLRRRMPPPQASPEQLQIRSWWSGPDIYIVVDDYDLVAVASPLTSLVEFLPYSKDLGLHLIVARRSAGAARAMFEPLLASLRDLSGMALIMSGSCEEGPLIGSVRPTSLPPGRGTLITRSGAEQLVQVGWSPP
ncbi:MAG: type VII secretion protein EccCb, partial [Mycobacterium sp.]|nr:type VII secretion protein EccCb [Mycobacterium sp.]